MSVTLGEQPAKSDAFAERGRFVQLLAAMQAGSQDAARELVETYGRHIRSVVKRRLSEVLRPVYDSEDFVQSAWKSLFAMGPEKIDRIHHPGQLINLMATIAGRKIIDEYRKRTQPACNALRRRSLDDPEVLAAIARIASRNSPSQVCIAREQSELYRQRWEELVNRQTERDRRIVHLRLEGAEYAEIAQAAEVSERQARRIVKRILERLSGTDRAA